VLRPVRTKQLIRSRWSNELRRCGSSLLGVLLFAYAPTLAAQELAHATEGRVQSPENANAKELATEGLTAFAAGRHAEAIEKFEAAYRLVPAPGLLYNAAQAYRLSGDCVLALARYRAFLATGAGEKTRQLAEQRIAELEPCHTELGAQPEAVAMPAPANSASVTEALPLTLRAQERPRGRDAPPTAAPSSSGSAKKLGYAAVGYGGSLLLLSLSAYFGVRARDASERVSNASEQGRTWNADLAATERSGQRDQAVALGALAGGVVSLGVVTCLLAFDW